MVVALGALDAHAHEHLGDVLGHFQRVALDVEIIRGRTCERAAAGREQLAHHFVDRHVAADLLFQPVEIQKCRFAIELVGGANFQ